MDCEVYAISLEMTRARRGAPYLTSAETPLIGTAEYRRQRFLECVPAGLLVLTLSLPAVLLLISPAATYVALVGFMIFWAVQAVLVMINHAREAHALRRYRQIDWDARLTALSDPYQRLQELAQLPRPNRSEREEHAALRNWVHAGAEVPSPSELHHLALIPVYNEDPEIVIATLQALRATRFDKRRLHICITFEERSPNWTPTLIERTVAQFRPDFATLLTTRHPDGLPGEGRVKGANSTWGAKHARAALHRQGLRDEQLMVTTIDSDCRPSENYFQILSYLYLTNPTREFDCYQPIPMFHNNIWQVNVAARLIASVASTSAMVHAGERSATLFSSYSLSMTTLVAVNYWSLTVIPDDSRMYWRIYFASSGRARIVPMHTTVSADAVDAGDVFSSLAMQYTQVRRWGYGVIDIPYVATQNLQRREIPAGRRLLRSVLHIASFHQWALAPILLLGSRWVVDLLLPYVQTPEFNVVDVTQFLYGISPPITLLMVAIGALISISQMPPNPNGKVIRSYLRAGAEWLLLPFVAVMLYCLPAIDAQLRLAAGKYLGFQVTAKSSSRSLRSPVGAG